MSKNHQPRARTFLDLFTNDKTCLELISSLTDHATFSTTKAFNFPSRAAKTLTGILFLRELSSGVSPEGKRKVEHSEPEVFPFNFFFDASSLRMYTGRCNSLRAEVRGKPVKSLLFCVVWVLGIELLSPGFGTTLLYH